MTIIIMASLWIGAVLAQTAPPELRISMISLGVKDMTRSVEFYSQTLGMQLAGQPGEVTLVRAGEVGILLNSPLGHAAGNTIVGATEVIFAVPSVAAAHANLLARGCKFKGAPREVTSGTWAATFTDPDGHRLTLLGAR